MTVVRRFARQLRPTLDSFDFWVAVAYFGLVALMVGLFFVNQNTQHALSRQAKDEATHAAEIGANAQSQYHLCVSSIPTLRKINAFIDGQRVTAAALVTNSKANLAATQKNDPLYELRVRNLHRLQRAERAAAVVKFPIPTAAQCAALRRSLIAKER